ncbi:MAG: hypothetical protein KME45_25275 [Stenomitos rutilans HA7619-LM2]|jgi:hypothetical protein|nr:hypothetical protein [Stenomitos rutilans HA7619-LM2]
MARKRLTSRRAVMMGSFVSALLLAMSLLVFWSVGLERSPAFAQRVRPEGVWQTVYERVPDLPKENQYVSKETGKVASDNTLVGRLIRYHLYVVGRSPLYRFDWKLTIADYLGLGLNGSFDETSYPSRATLKTNPAEGDRAAINRLTRSQRDALVQALVDGFTAPTANVDAPTPQPSPSQKPQPNAKPPDSGGASLLKP